jgi:IS5 family transposase
MKKQPKRRQSRNTFSLPLTRLPKPLELLRREGKGIGFRVAMRPGKRRALPDTPEGRVDDLIETAKAHIRAKVEHPFRVMKRQFGFQKTRLRGMLKNRCKVNVLAALTNLFMARHQLLSRT